jgi:putative nucleotidyltransferase with HDIG domain
MSGVLCEIPEEHRGPFALAVLLHDIGKPPTQTFEDRIRFNGHDQVGAEMAAEVLDRLKVPTATKDIVVSLIAGHMRIPFFPKMKKSKKRRFVQDPLCDLHCHMHFVDSSAASKKFTGLEEVREYKITEAARPPEPKIESVFGGKDLIAMGFKPGPQFGIILDAVRDEQLEDRIKTNEQARGFVTHTF